MRKPLLGSIVLAVVLALPGAVRADECRKNCVAAFKIFRQGCIDNSRGAVRKGCIKGAKLQKKILIKRCRHGEPQACPPVE